MQSALSKLLVERGMLSKQHQVGCLQEHCLLGWGRSIFLNILPLFISLQELFPRHLYAGPTFLRLPRETPDLPLTPLSSKYWVITPKHLQSRGVERERAIKVSRCPEIIIRWCHRPEVEIMNTPWGRGKGSKEMWNCDLRGHFEGCCASPLSLALN